MKMKMMQCAAVAVCFAFIAALTAAVPSTAQSAQKTAAIVTFVKGKVEVKRAGKQEFEELTASSMLYERDEVRTSAQAQAALALTGGAEVRLNENSHFKVPSGKKRGEEVNLSMGQIWTRMLHKMAKLKVRTPTAVAAVRGTEADIETREIMTVKVYEGHVDLSNSKGTQSLKAGQMSQVSGAGAAPSPARDMQPGEKGTWQEGITIENVNEFVDKLNAASGIKGKKTLELDIKKEGGESKKVKVELDKK